jgi:hypothetical protein
VDVGPSHTNIPSPLALSCKGRGNIDEPLSRKKRNNKPILQRKKDIMSLSCKGKNIDKLSTKEEGMI